MHFNPEIISFFSMPGGTLVYAPSQEMEIIKTMFANQSKFRVYRGLDSVMVFHDNNYPQDELKTFILSNTEFVHDDNKSSEVVVIPVLYDFKSKDWPFLENLMNTDRVDISELHQSCEHVIEMYGFLPGFPYIKNISHSFTLPRKQVPDPRIQPGSLALADNYTGIYPVESPGGWHVIGSCPIKFLDAHRENPVLHAEGTKIRFEAISKNTNNIFQ